MACLIRPAAPEDAAAVCTVVRRSIVECCGEDHRHDPVLLHSWLANKTVPHVRAWLENDRACSVVAEAEGGVVGFGMSQADEVLLCYLVPEARFKGMGQSLLQALENHALAAGQPVLRLESTLTALAFYARNAYQSTGPARTAFGLAVYPLAKPLPGRPHAM